MGKNRYGNVLKNTEKAPWSWFKCNAEYESGNMMVQYNNNTHAINTVGIVVVYYDLRINLIHNFFFIILIFTMKYCIVVVVLVLLLFLCVPILLLTYTGYYSYLLCILSLENSLLLSPRMHRHSIININSGSRSWI